MGKQRTVAQLPDQLKDLPGAVGWRATFWGQGLGALFRQATDTCEHFVYETWLKKEASL